MLAEVLGFAVVAGLVTIVPGLDTALVLRSAITQSRRHAFATALGINSGVLVWGVAAAVGLSALLAASEVGYTVLRLLGAAYMVYFGVSLLWRTWRGRGATDVSEPEEPSAGGLPAAWGRGFLVNLLNPKVGAFYLALLPQFLPPDVHPLTGGVLLALVHNAEGLVWFLALIFGTGLVRRRLASAGVRRAVDRITGVVLVGLGLRLALSADSTQ